MTVAGVEPAILIVGTAGAAARWAHDVSILMQAGRGAGRVLGVSPRANTSMTSSRPPQHGHGVGQTRGWSAAGASATTFGSGAGGITPSSSRALAMLAARLPLASKP